MKQAFKRYIDFTLRSWSSQTTLRLSTLVILIFTYSITVFLSQSALNFKRVLNRWGDDTKMTVYLADGQTDETRKRIESFLGTIGDVQMIRFVSQEEAIAQFSKKNSLFTNEFLEDLKDQEVFPESFEVTMKGSIQNQAYLKKLKTLSETIDGQIGVEEVSYGQGWIEKYSAFLNLMNSLVAAIVFLFLAASLMIISNLVRVLVYNQRDEIEILELIGETKANIRMPFVLEGIVFSSISFAIGLMLNMVIFTWISTEFAQSTLLNHMANLVAQPQILFIAIGFFLSAFVGFLSSYYTAKSINTGWALSNRTNR